jgi:hypothetical protein
VPLPRGKDLIPVSNSNSAKHDAYRARKAWGIGILYKRLAEEKSFKWLRKISNENMGLAAMFLAANY